MEEQRSEDSAAQTPIQQQVPATAAEIEKFAQGVINKHVEFKVGEETKQGDNFWRVLVKFVLEELEHLKDLNPVVDVKPTWRVKLAKSLQGKIERLQKEGQNDGKLQTMDSIRNMRWDIAGTRMCLYFPCQLQQVKDFIEANECFEVIPNTSRNKEKDTEPRSAKLFREREYSPRNQETRPYKERMGYYEADHYWIRLNKTHPRVLAMVPNYDDEAIEIQIRTTLMDAWAEVRHDLEYKHILGYPSEAELRVLDAIKGTIASCEIMQDHLFILREQRIKRDEEEFNFKEPDHCWKAIVNTLQPRHRLFLEEFGEVGPVPTASGRHQATRFLETCKIRTPHALKERIGLVGTDEQNYALSRMRDIFRSTYPSQELPPSSRDCSYGARHISSGEKLTLFRFIAIVLFVAMSVEEIQETFYDKDYLLISESSMRVVRGDAPWELQLNKRNVAICAWRWYQMLSTVVRTLSCWAEEDKQFDLETVSITWHVHEWAATTYQNTTKHDQIIRAVSSLCSHYKTQKNNAYSQRALWLCAAVSFIHWECEASVNCHMDADDWTAWSQSRQSNGWTLISQEWEDNAWLRGEQVAAEIIGIEPRELNHVTLYRSLFQSPEEDKYVLHCLDDEDIDVNWQDSCGISLLGAAAAFGTRRVCEAMLAQQGVNPNLRFPDGLSLIHIAIAHKNDSMVGLLAAHPDLDIEVIWNRDNETGYEIARFWYMCNPKEQWNRVWKDWSEEKDEKNVRYEEEPKHSWTAVEMARHRLSCCNDDDERPKLISVYNLLKSLERPEAQELNMRVSVHEDT